MVIHFGHEVDLRRVVEGGPWSFDDNLLVLRELRPGEHPVGVDLCFADFWVQVFGLPVGFYSESIGKGLGNYIGDFKGYDDDNF
ncbi:hypothetical protein LINPERHAP1_LOCUS26527 [Linum perenne]